jgi:hypothetical protein
MYGELLVRRRLHRESPAPIQCAGRGSKDELTVRRTLIFATRLMTMANKLIEKLGRRSAAYLRKLGGVDSAIEFLEKDEWTFGSGYAKADLVRLLRKLDLKPVQAERLRRVVLAVVDGRDRREFRHYCQLACKLDSPRLREELMRRLEDENEVVRRHARWALEYLSRHQAN